MRKKQVLVRIVSILVIAISTKTLTDVTVGISLLNGTVATIAFYTLVWMGERLMRRYRMR